MVVRDRDTGGALCGPAEDNAPLVVDPDRVPAGCPALERLTRSLMPHIFPGRAGPLPGGYLHCVPVGPAVRPQRMATIPARRGFAHGGLAAAPYLFAHVDSTVTSQQGARG